MSDRSSRISEFIDGTPSSRGRPSAEEVKTKAAAGNQYLANIIQRLEETALVPLLELTYEHLLEFGDDLTDPTFQQVAEGFGGIQQVADLKSRLRVLNQPFKIKAEGISMAMDRSEWMGRYRQMMQLLMQTGLARANRRDDESELHRTEAMGVDPSRLGLADSPEQQAMMLMQMSQAAAPPGGSLPNAEAQGGGSPSAGAPPPPGPNVTQ
jgi:hypothetical protein